MENKLQALAVVGLALLLASCAKKDESRVVVDTSGLQILSDDGFYLEHVVINVRGPGMPLVSYRWDGEWREGENPQPLPPFFEVKVPAGSERLIQFLGVARNSDELMKFQYGDTTMSFGPGDVAVDIPVKNFGGTSREHGFKGKFVRANGTTPTGKVEWFFTPPDSTKPLVFVEDKMIYGGWFDFMLFDAAPITYRMKGSGEVLFNAILPDTLDAQLTTAQHFAKITFPEFFYGHPDGGDTKCSPSGSSNSSHYMGYFGPGAGSVASDVEIKAGGSLIEYNDGYYTGLFTSCVNNVVPDPETMGLEWNSPSGIEFHGAAQMTAGESCSPSTPFCISAAHFVNGPNQALAEGPFKVLPGRGGADFYRQGPLTFHHSTEPGPWPKPHAAMEWETLPGVASLVDRFEVFTRPAHGNRDIYDYEADLDKMGCVEFLEQSGFKRQTSVKTPVDSENPNTFRIDQQMDRFLGKDLAICPVMKAGGKTIAAAHVAFATEDPLAVVEGLPVPLEADGYFYQVTKDLTLQLKVNNVKQFKYMHTSSDECPADPQEYTGPTYQGGSTITVTAMDEGLQTLCVIGSNKEGVWSHPQRHEWEYDSVAPTFTFYCTRWDGFYNIELSSSEPIHPGDRNLSKVGLFKESDQTEVPLSLVDVTTSSIIVEFSDSASPHPTRLQVEGVRDFAGNMSLMKLEPDVFLSLCPAP